MIRKVLVLLVILLSCVGCDQVTKRAASQWLYGESTRSYVGDSFRLLYTENTGAFLGMGAEWPAFIRWGAFTLVSALAVFAALYWLLRRVHRGGTFQPYGQTWGVLLVAAGGIGNLIDRVLRDGAVIDFMNFGIGPLRTGIFNIADVQIVLGLGLMMFWKSRKDDTTVGAKLTP